MKKMIIFGVGLLLAAGAVFFATHNKPLTAEEALLLKNVEAIAQNEGGGDNGDEAEYRHMKTCLMDCWEVTPSGAMIYVGQRYIDLLTIDCLCGNSTCTPIQPC